MNSIPRTVGTKQRALVASTADMWLTGGASLLAFALCYALTGAVFHPDTAGRTPSWVFFAVVNYAAFACNYPHFLYSYMLFYPSYFKLLSAPDTGVVCKMRLSITAFLIPSLMIGYFIYAWHLQNPQYLGWAVYAMMFLGGWHYVKQGYGSLITLSLYENVFYSVWEKRVLNANAYAAWIYTLARVHSYAGKRNYYDVSYYTPYVFPSWVVQGCLILSCLTTAGVIGFLLKRRLYDKKRISSSGILGYVAAIYMWVMLPYLNAAFSILIPFFHSLQYLPFVYKYKKSEIVQAERKTKDDTQKVTLRIATSLIHFTFWGIVLGAIFLELLPKVMDKAFWTYGLGQHFFLIFFIVFINIHHFFIDSAFWRKDNPNVQRYLFQS